MGIPGESRAQLVVKFAVVFPHLDERQRRLLMGAEARILGHGGVRVVARAAGTSETTVRKGMDELEVGEAPLGRVRRRGGGRKKAADVDPELRPALLALVEPDMRGDPMSALRWTVKSTRQLADELGRQGHRVCADTVGDLLREEGFSLQGNAKTLEGKQHPDRDAQFRYLNEQAKRSTATRPDRTPLPIRPDSGIYRAEVNNRADCPFGRRPLSAMAAIHLAGGSRCTPVARGLRRSPHRCHSGALTLYPSGHLVEIASALRKSLVASLSVIGQTSTLLNTG
jgi:DDE family transposase